MKYKELKEELITQFLNDSVHGQWYWNEDGSVNVDGTVRILNFKVSKLSVKFNKVTGCFNCSSVGLTTHLKIVQIS